LGEHSVNAIVAAISQSKTAFVNLALFARYFRLEINDRQLEINRKFCQIIQRFVKELSLHTKTHKNKKPFKPSLNFWPT